MIDGDRPHGDAPMPFVTLQHTGEGRWPEDHTTDGGACWCQARLTASGTMTWADIEAFVRNHGTKGQGNAER